MRIVCSIPIVYIHSTSGELEGVIMTREVVVHDNAKLKDQIIKLIESNMSAIPLIAEQLEIDEMLVRALILEAVEEGLINGHLSPDETRFYRSDIKMPTASAVSIEEYEIPPPPSILVQKAILGSGIGLFIAGQILIRLVEAETTMYNISTMLVFGGLVTIILGLCSLSKAGSK